jgi:lysyl endopeptidase
MTAVHSRMRAVIAVAASLATAVAWPAYAEAPITAVPPAELKGGATIDKSPTPKMSLSQATPAVIVALPAATTAERDLLKARNASFRKEAGTKATPKRSLAVAFPRDIPAGVRSVALAGLPWQTLADGSRAATVQVASEGAAALRVALKLSAAASGVTFRFAGNGAHAQTFGPMTSSAVASDSAAFGSFWSPVLEGDVATIEIHVDAGAPTPEATLTLARISHQVVAPAALRNMDAKTVQDIGLAGSCNIDVACVTPQTTALLDAARAVAEMEFTQDDGFTHLCTGTLMNDSIGSNTPYFFSAAHCLNTATAARTLNTYWFFDAIACGNNAVPPYVQQASGATLLARSGDWDWALARLNAPPPAGARFSAWRAETMPTQTPITVLHHPEADLKKWSAGSTQGYQVYTDGSSFALVHYDQGTTEPGSSGAGLLTFLQAGGYYELRGGLWSGEASCQNKSGLDEYSRIDNMLPLTRAYLTPGTPGTAGQAVAVEFYNASLDHYFITISQGEINDLDNKVHPGWERTGMRFLAYDNPAAGTSPVCRFFFEGEPFGSSHFYSASPTECATVVNNPQTYPGWIYESASVFYIALPNPLTGACADGTQPVWRFYNQRKVNHRYTIDQVARDEMRDDPATWQPEGYGPDNVIMCAPTG